MSLFFHRTTEVGGADCPFFPAPPRSSPTELSRAVLVPGVECTSIRPHGLLEFSRTRERTVFCNTSWGFRLGLKVPKCQHLSCKLFFSFLLELAADLSLLDEAYSL